MNGMRLLELVCFCFGFGFEIPSRFSLKDFEAG